MYYKAPWIVKTNGWPQWVQTVPAAVNNAYLDLSYDGNYVNGTSTIQKAVHRLEMASPSYSNAGTHSFGKVKITYFVQFKGLRV